MRTDRSGIYCRAVRCRGTGAVPTEMHLHWKTDKCSCRVGFMINVINAGAMIADQKLTEILVAVHRAHPFSVRYILAVCVDKGWKGAV